MLTRTVVSVALCAALCGCVADVIEPGGSGGGSSTGDGGGVAGTAGGVAGTGGGSAAGAGGGVAAGTGGGVAAGTGGGIVGTGGGIVGTGGGTAGTGGGVATGPGGGTAGTGGGVATGTGGGTSGTGGGSVASNGADWATRSRAPGVLWATAFGTASEVDNWRWNNAQPGGWDPTSAAAGSSRVQWRSGEGLRPGTNALRIEDTTTSGANNSALWWRTLDKTATAGENSVDYLVAPGQTVYAQFALKVNTTRLNSFTGSGLKIFSFSSAAATNTEQEAFVMRNTGRQYVSVSNSNSPTPWYYTDLGAGAYDMQPGSQFGTCRYNADSPPSPGCYYLPADAWLYYHVTLKAGTAPGANTDIKVEVVRPGDTRYTTIYHRANLDLSSYSNGNGYSALLLWNRAENHTGQLAGAYHHFSDIIVSLNPIPVPVESSAPAWLTSMPVSSWATINTPGDTLSSHVPCPGNNCSYSGNSGYSCILDDCWNGAILASKYGTKGGYVAWGGGHNGYHGGEVYAFDFATRAWSRLSEPQTGGSPSCPGAGSAADGVYDSTGSAIAPHTYYNTFYHAPTNSLATMRVETSSCGGQELTKPARFNLDTHAWSFAATTGPTNAYAGWTVFDSKRNLVLTEGGDTGAVFLEYSASSDLLSGSYVSRPRKFASLEGPAALDTQNDVLMMVDAPYGCGRHDPYLLDMNNRGATPTAMTTAGTVPNLCEGSLVYVAGISAFLFRPSGTGSAVYKVQRTSGSALSGTYTWTNLTSGSNTVVPQSPASDTGRYSKFNCIEYSDAIGCVEVNSVSGSVYAYRVR